MSGSTGRGADAETRSGWAKALDALNGQELSAGDKEYANTLMPRVNKQCAAYMITRGEMAVLDEIGRDRNAQNRAAGVPDGKRSNRDSVELDIQGVYAEFAVLRMMGIDLTALFDTTPRCVRTDYGHDVQMSDGSTIDVKSSRGWNPATSKLRVHMAKRANPATYYVQIALYQPYGEDAENCGVFAMCPGYKTGKEVFNYRLFYPSSTYDIPCHELTLGLPSG